MKRFTSLFWACFCFTFISATEPAFHKVDVKEGEGIYSLLRRYSLNDQVSLDKFYELNKLNPESHLIVGKNYYLPILIYQYDGVSIRSTIGVDDWNLASRIAAFNKTLLERGLRKTTYQESNILWVPFYEINREKKSLEEEPKAIAVAASTTTRRYSLFGKKAEVVSIKSQKLKDKVFYIVSGHGGPDPGAMAETGGHTLCEDEYAYDVSLRLAKNLMEQGAIVEMIVQDPNDGIRSEKYLRCDKDEVTLEQKQMPINQLLRLQQRVHLVNQLHKQYLKEGLKDQTVICIHVDSQGPSAQQDVYFYYYEESESGKKLANSIQDTFRKKYQEHRSGRGYRGTVRSRSLYELRHTDPKAVYVELANIQNHNDLKRILPESNRQALANWLFEGLMAAH